MKNKIENTKDTSKSRPVTEKNIGFSLKALTKN
jgi:hypothetical protein